jgi:hypothetical protein
MKDTAAYVKDCGPEGTKADADCGKDAYKLAEACGKTDSVTGEPQRPAAWPVQDGFGASKP